MKTKRIFFSLTLILLLILGGVFVSTWSDENIYEVEKSYYENDLRNYFWIKKWEKYEKTIALFSEKSIHESEKIIKKLEKVKIILEAKEEKTKKDIIQIALVSYLINSLEWARYNEEIRQVSIITEEEKEEVEGKILVLQKLLIHTIKEWISVEWNTQKGIEQTGKVHIEAYTPLLWSPLSTSIKLDDINSKTKDLDSQFSTNLDFSLDMNEETMHFRSFMEIISKENEIYLLLKNLEILAEENEEFAKFFTLLEEINEKNGYLHLKNNSQNNTIQSLSIEKNLENYKKILRLENESIFKVTKKEWEKYVLLPKKEACDIIMESFGEVCKDSDYQNILKLFLTHKASLYLSEENWNYSLEFLSMIDNDMIQKARISYNTNDITSLDYSLIPNQNKFPWEKLELSYKKNKTLKALLIADMKKEQTAYANIDFSLNNKNQVETGDWKINIENFSSEWEIKNNEISGHFNRKDTYNNRGINGTIKWNIEENIAINFNSEWYKWDLIGDINISKKDFSIIVNFNWEQTGNFNFSFTWTLWASTKEAWKMIFHYDVEGTDLFIFSLDYELETIIKSLNITAPTNTFELEELDSYKSVNY